MFLQVGRWIFSLSQVIGLALLLTTFAWAAPVGSPPGGARTLEPGHIPKECTESDRPFNEYGATYGAYWSERAQDWVSAPYCYPRWGFLRASPSQAIGAGDTVTIVAIPDDGRIPGLVAAKGGMQWTYPGRVVSGCGTKDVVCTVQVGTEDDLPAEWDWQLFHVSGPGRVFILPPSYGRCPESDPCLDTYTNAWSFAGVMPESASPTLELSISARTGQSDFVLPGQAIHYTLTATGARARPTKNLTVSARIPANTKLEPNSYGDGKVKGKRIEWTFTDRKSATVGFDVTLPFDEDLPSNANEIKLQASARSTGPGGTVSASAEHKLPVDRLNFDVADADPHETAGVTFPSAEAPTLLPKLGTIPMRRVDGIAADGVAMLLLHATTRSSKHGKFRFSVDEVELGAPTGSVWAPDDTSIIDAEFPGGNRDTMPEGATTVEVESNPHPQDSRESIAYALYRAPRNFDGDASTSNRRSRSIKLKVELLAEDGGEVLQTKTVDMKIVRPLVILQHGTFDSPDGWKGSGLFFNTANELTDYLAATPDFPFETHRGNFSTYKRASGDLLGTVPVAWNSVNAAMENWRKVRNVAAAQVDVVAHSYGGVIMRWIAQSQAEANNPMALDSAANYRNVRNWGHGLFHKLITIATTHRGSAVSNQLADINRNGRKTGLIHFLADKSGAPIHLGGVEDQMVVSPQLRQLQRTRVPGHVIAGSGLCGFNAEYAKRLLMIWAADIDNGPFRSLGEPINAEIFRKLSNYGFNLRQELMDDTSQDPNYDLTVSSWSSKAGMPLQAQTTVAELEAELGLSATELVGRVTHGDEISAGSGDRRPVDAVAQRVAFLLRQPTSSSYFAAFPGFDQLPLTITEQAFSDQQRFDPHWLYIGYTDIILSVLPSAQAALDSVPTLTVDPPGPTVVPGQTLQIAVTPSAAGLDSGLLTWPTDQAGVPGLVQLSATSTSATITVPNRRPGPFSIAAVVFAPDGGFEQASLDLEIVDGAAYTELRADPAELTIRQQGPVSVIVRGKLGDDWRDLSESPRLVLSSSAPEIVSITDDGLLQPGQPGQATITATFDGSLQTMVQVTVEGEPVKAMASRRTRGRLRSKQSSLADFVFLSGNQFDPATIDAATVTVDAEKPKKCKLVKDANGDGVKELACYVRPKNLGLQKGANLISMHAMAKGLRITGRMAVTVR